MKNGSHEADHESNHNAPSYHDCTFPDLVMPLFSSTIKVSDSSSWPCSISSVAGFYHKTVSGSEESGYPGSGDPDMVHKPAYLHTRPDQDQDQSISPKPSKAH